MNVNALNNANICTQVIRSRTLLVTRLPYQCVYWCNMMERYRPASLGSVCQCRHKNVILNIAYLLTYLLTSWCRVLLEKLTGLQLVKKFHAFHGTRRFITALTSVRHLSLSWASPIQSIYTHFTCWRSVIILSTHLRLGLPSGLLPSCFPSKTLYTPSPHPYAPHSQPISVILNIMCIKDDK